MRQTQSSVLSQLQKEMRRILLETHTDFEARGIGGLFFDYLKETQEMKMEDWYNFVTEVGNSFLEAYVPIVEKEKTYRLPKPIGLGKKFAVVVM